jgi:predicted ATPase
MRKFPVCVFLEGGAGVGKSSLADCMAQRGFQVHFENFVELSQQHPVYNAGGIVLSFKWAAKMIERMEQLTSLYGKDTCPPTPQERLVFFDRSLYTPYVWDRLMQRYNRGTRVANVLILYQYGLISAIVTPTRY